MVSALAPVAVLLSALAAADAGLRPGSQVAFRGEVADVRPDHSIGEPTKTFDLTFVVVEMNERGSKLLWTIEERGHGAWPWAERFGQWTLDDAHQPVGAVGPSLLYDYGDGRAVIPLTVPLFSVKGPPAAGTTWESQGMQYKIEKAAEVDNRKTWQISVENKFGPKRTLWLAQSSPLVVGFEERVFMNMGREHRLRWRLVGVEALADDQFAAISSGFTALVALRTKLNRPAREESELWTAEQRRVLVEGLPAVQKAVTSGPLVKLVRAADRDLGVQADRANAVAELKTKYEGQPAPKFKAGALGRDTLSDGDLKDNVTLLHFWDYRDTPLEEPYGQVGYLEFLFSRHKAAGAKVYGVAVDGRLNDEATRSQVGAGVRKLKSFMNLSYPIVLDGGGILKQFGDPRLLGAELPLFVVVGPDGKIVHYHVGYYEVDRQDGLKELDQVIAAELKKKP